jgi:hypothetical protein
LLAELTNAGAPLGLSPGAPISKVSLREKSV